LLATPPDTQVESNSWVFSEREFATITNQADRRDYLDRTAPRRKSIDIAWPGQDAQPLGETAPCTPTQLEADTPPAKTHLMEVDGEERDPKRQNTGEMANMTKDMMREMMREFMEKTSDRCAERTAEVTKGHLQEMKELSREMRDMHKNLIVRMDEHEKSTDNRITTMEGQIVAMKDLVDKLLAERKSDAASAAGSTSTVGRTGGYAGGGPRRDGGRWIPGFVEVKGWVKDWKNPTKRAEQMLTGEELERLQTGLKAAVPTEMWSVVDESETAKHNCNRVLYAKLVLRLKKDTTNDQAWSLRRSIEDNKSKYVSLPSGARAAVEAAPWKMPHLAACGRLLGTLRELGANAAQLKMEVGPPESKIFTLSERPKILATYKTEEQGWNLMPVEVEKVVPGKSCEEVLRVYRENS